MTKEMDAVEDLIIKLKKLIKRIEQLSSHLDFQEISRSQYRVIFPMIKNKQGYSSAELTELTGADKALISRTITDLEAKGIVIRDKKADSNEKNYKIIFSEKGKALLHKQRDKVKEISAEWFSGITKDEIVTFCEILNRITQKQPEPDTKD